MNITEFDYNLPEELIAQEPPKDREESRLLVVNRNQHTWQHYEKFSLIENYFQPGDVLVLNNTKVLYARLIGKRATGGKVEALILHSQNNIAEALIQTTRRPKEGEKFQFGSYQSTILGRGKEGWNLDFGTANVMKIMQEIGLPPLPPYIKRKYKNEDTTKHPQVLFDRERYQTIYAKVLGSVAAPTAGFHFTPNLLEKLRAKGVEITEVTLHVGTGTFLPIKVEQIEQHVMHYESYSVSPETATIVNTALDQGRRVIATGTTSCRTLESAGVTGRIIPGENETNLFIYPGYNYKIIQGLITNFHLPKSTLLLLVSTFAGTELIRKVYEDAIQKRYHFFSYGDAMFIF